MPFGYSYGLSIVNMHLNKGASLVVTKKTLFDKKFFSLLLIFPLFILIFLSIIKLKKILFDRNLFKLNADEFFFDHTIISSRSELYFSPPSLKNNQLKVDLIILNIAKLIYQSSINIFKKTKFTYAIHSNKYIL